FINEFIKNSKAKKLTLRQQQKQSRQDMKDNKPKV
ncbi:MAG: hypothetical protein RLZ33_2324, partial [Bacteroidota bacterium]